MTQHATHPEGQLIPYVTGELKGIERRQVADHLAACAECAGAAEDFRQILSDLGSSVPEPPPIHWGAYRAELREKLEARRRRSWGVRWFWQPVPAALTAALAGALLVLALQPREPRAPVTGDLASLEETVAASRLDLLRQYAMLERLELWEDWDIVRHLDEIRPTQSS